MLPAALPTVLHRAFEPARPDPDPSPYLRKWTATRAGTGNCKRVALGRVARWRRMEFINHSRSCRHVAILAPDVVWLPVTGSGCSWPLYMLDQLATRGSPRYST